MKENVATSGKKIEGVSRPEEPLGHVNYILLQLHSMLAMQSSAKFYSLSLWRPIDF